LKPDSHLIKAQKGEENQNLLAKSPGQNVTQTVSNSPQVEGAEPSPKIQRFIASIKNNL
jgi:hypothetical protein